MFNNLISLLDPIKNKIFLMICRGYLKSIDNSKKYQEVTINVFETETIIKERFQEFGLESYPVNDGNSECLLLSPNGNRDRGIVINIQNREYRPNDLNEGETTIYAKSSDNKNKTRINLKQNDIIEITTKDSKTIKIDNSNNIEIKWDANNKLTLSGSNVEMKGTEIKLNNANEAFVKGTTAKIEMTKDQVLMQTLQAAISAWTPIPNDGGAALKTALSASFLTLPQASYSDILSTTIKGS